MSRTGIRGFVIAALVLALALPVSAAADRTVYVTNSDSAATALAAFDSAGGPLEPLKGTPVAAGDDTNGVLVSPDARHAYVANTGDDTIQVYALSAGGKPKTVGTTPTGNQPTGLGFTPDGAFLLVTNRDSSEAAPSVSVFAVNADDGTLTAVGTPVDVGVHDPRAVVVSPDGRFVYVTARRGPLGPPPSNADTAIAVLSIDANGALNPIVGSPFFQVGEFNAFGASITPDGKFLYVAQASQDKIDAFSLDATTGAPTPILGSPFAAGAMAPIELSVTPDGGSLYVTEAFGQAVEGFTINPTTGALSQIAGTPVRWPGRPTASRSPPTGPASTTRSSPTRARSRASRSAPAAASRG